MRFPVELSALEMLFWEGGPVIALSPDGSRLAYVAKAGVPGEDWQLYIRRLDRLEATPLSGTEGGRQPFFSTDGEWVAFFAGGELKKVSVFTFAPGADAGGVWSPDGERLAFSSSRGGSNDIFWKRADGTGEAERLTESSNPQFPNAWSPDGEVLAFVEMDLETNTDIWVLPLEGKREPRPLIKTSFNEYFPCSSSDGRWLAYESDASGRFEIYVQPYPGLGGQYQISTDGGRKPLWGPDGTELFYRQGDSMMVVSYTVEGESFQPGRPRELFQGPFLLIENQGDADIAPDGKGFVMLQRAAAEEGAAEPSQVILVTNWFEESERMIPRDN